MERVNVLDALGNWSSLDGPLYRRLATAVREAVAAGFLPAGHVLPPERSMAKALAIGRSTVVAAYDLLREEGVLESRQGSGTWVSGAGRGRGGSPARAALQGATPDAGAATVDLATASLPAADAVADVLAELPDDGAAQLLARTEYSPLGIPELRAAVAELFTRQGLETGPHQVLITTGDQQALWLLTEHCVAAGDLAVVEDPTSAGLLDLLHARSATVRAVPPVAGHGARPVADVLGRTRPALVYLALAPDVRGRVCRPEDLPALAAALGAAEGTAVEDTAGRDLCFDDPPPLLARLRGGEDVVTVGSTSKLFWSGLRVGWLRGDPGLVRRLGRIKARADLGTPLLSQFLAARLLERWDEVRRDRVARLRADLDSAAAVLAAELPGLAWDRPDAGVSVWLRLPGGASAPFAEVALRHGVAVVAASSLSPGGGADDQIRVTYARPPGVFTEGVRRLRAAWEDYRRSPAGAAPAAEPWPV